jgi:uncharacterized membrane protein YfcA
VSGAGWQFALLGLLVGTLVGMTGMGGGSLMTPLLMIAFGFDPGQAVGTDILHGAVFKSFGAVRHRVLGSVHARLAGWMILGSAPMSLIGVGISHRLGEGAQPIQTRIIGAALVLGGIGFLAKVFLKRGVQPSDAPFLLARRDRLIAFALGASGGLVVGLTSVGSGTFFGLVMLLAFPLTARKIVGTDIFHASALLWVAGVGYVVTGQVVWHAFFWMLLGSIPGIMIGSQITVRIPDRVLRVAFSIVLILSGFKVLDLLPEPWTDRVVAAGLALALLGFASWGLWRLLGRRSGARIGTGPRRLGTALGRELEAERSSDANGG